MIQVCLTIGAIRKVVFTSGLSYIILH